MRNPIPKGKKIAVNIIKITKLIKKELLIDLGLVEKLVGVVLFVLNNLSALTDVLLYTRLYSARLGLVINPIPLGAFKPRLCRTSLFHDVLAANLLFNDGILIPNFIEYFYIYYFVY